MPESPTKVRVGGATALPSYVSSRGGAAERVLHEAGIVEAVIQDEDAWISLDRMGALYEAAARELADPLFGIKFGTTVPLQSYGLLSYVVLNAPDVRTALRNVARYSGSLSVSGITVALVAEGTLARLAFTLDSATPDLCRQYFESVGAVLCVMMKALAGDQWKPNEICFEHSAAGSPKEAARRLQTTVRYGATRHSLAFDSSCLANPVPGADRSLLPLIKKHVDDVVGQSEADPLVARLRDELARTLCDGKPGIDSIAHRLAMSPRTLQRRLHAQGIRFKSLLNETRVELAKEYLAQPTPTVTEIAFLLGYGELSAFDRAFRREMGTSPTSWRRTRLSRR